MGCHVEIKAIDGGEITIGSNVHFADNATVVCRYGSLTIGNNSYVGKGSVIVARERITVGRGALIAEYVTIRDQHHGMERAELAFYEQPFTTSPISIGENVWLGAKSTVLKGVAIGSDVVVGANSVVTKDVADKSTVVGVPARLTGPTA